MKKKMKKRVNNGGGKSYVKKHTDKVRNIKSTVKDILYTGGMIAAGVKVITPYVLGAAIAFSGH